MCFDRSVKNVHFTTLNIIENHKCIVDADVTLVYDS